MQHLTLPKTSIYYNLEVSASRYPEKAAFVYYGQILKYQQLKEHVDAVAGYLQADCGVEKGGRVLLYMQNSPQFVIAYYAIIRANGVVVPVNPMNLDSELAHYVEDSGADLILASQELYPNIEPLLNNGALRRVILATYSDYLPDETDLPLPDVVAARAADINSPSVISWQRVLSANAVPGPHSSGADDLCVLPYSSGTTGLPKGCMHTNQSVMAIIVAHASNGIDNSCDSKRLATLPLFHVSGMQASMNIPIYLGATVVLMTRWDRATAAELIQRYSISSWRSTTTMVIDLLSDPKLGAYDFSSLRSIGGGGAAMPEAIASRLRSLTGLEYLEGYGLTETMAGTHINPADDPRPQCLGQPVQNVKSTVVSIDSGDVLPPNDVGEIVIAGPQLFQGYWGRERATKEAFINLKGELFFRTGDMGYYDGDGYFYLVDRLKRMINASGYKVWPSEVESLMYEHPAVQEVCVISAPDVRRGETVKAVVVLADDHHGKITEHELAKWCRTKMAAYKAPKHFVFADSLPKSATGKIQWRQLQNQETGDAN